MEASIEAVRQNFQSKADTELLELAATSVGMTSEARLLLLQELQGRLAKAKQARETVQLVHGWYTVVAPIAGIKFPHSCPRCARSEANSSTFQVAGATQVSPRLLEERLGCFRDTSLFRMCRPTQTNSHYLLGSWGLSCVSLACNRHLVPSPQVSKLHRFFRDLLTHYVPLRSDIRC
jgi:hypothetical protein